MFISERVWTWAKVAGAIFNSYATCEIFYSMFIKSYSLFFAVLGTLLAIFLVDFILLALMQMLEAPLQVGELYRYRRPYANGLIILFVCIMGIGLASEGLYSIAPRIGIFILVYIAVGRFRAKLLAEKKELWAEEYNERKEKAEREDQLKLSQKQRKVKQEQEKLALLELKPLLKEKAKRRFIKQLGLDEPEVTVIMPEKKLVQMPLLTEGKSNGHLDPINVVDDYVYTTKKGYGWECPVCGKSSETKNNGEPYKEDGAKKMFARHYNQCLLVKQDN